jgi:hypothetical protein
MHLQVHWVWFLWHKRLAEAKCPWSDFGFRKERDFPTCARNPSAPNTDAGRPHLDIDGGGLRRIGMVGLEELHQLGMAKKAHANPLNSGFATRLDISAGERDATRRSLDAEQWVHCSANGPEQSNQRNAWHEESHG